MCGLALMSNLPHSVGGITGAVLVTDEAIEAWGAESLLAIRPFKPCFTQTGAIDMMTLGSILTLTPLVTQWTIGAHRTVILTPRGNLQSKDTDFQSGDLKTRNLSSKNHKHCFQLLKCEDLLFFSILYYHKLNRFEIPKLLI